MIFSCLQITFVHSSFSRTAPNMQSNPEYSVTVIGRSGPAEQEKVLASGIDSYPTHSMFNLETPYYPITPDVPDKCPECGYHVRMSLKYDHDVFHKALKTLGVSGFWHESHNLCCELEWNVCKRKILDGWSIWLIIFFWKKWVPLKIIQNVVQFWNWSLMVLERSLKQ